MAQWAGQLQLERLETPLVATGLLVAILWLLKARRNSVAAQNNEPPVLPYWIPWLGNALSYASGSEKVFRAARYVLRSDILRGIHSTRHSRNYTPGQGPVSIVLGGQTVYVRLVLNS
jgi:hypothetical protein